MRYLQFSIENYRAITQQITIPLDKHCLRPLIGINECGKTTILQAIFCFDYQNDNFIEQRHLKNILNLYEAKGNQSAVISAIIEISPEEAKDCYRVYLQKQAEYEIRSIIEQGGQDEQSPDEVRQELRDKRVATFMQHWGKQQVSLEIERHLDSRQRDVAAHCKYKSLKVVNNSELTNFIEKDEEAIADIDQFVKALLFYGPHILYSDDFNDRPPIQIKIPTKDQIERNMLNDWQQIYNVLFKKSLDGSTLHDVANEEDTRRQKNQLDDIAYRLNNDLQEAWMTFLPKNEQGLKENFKLQLTITYSGKTKKLDITVGEKMQYKDNEGSIRTFSITDRSKGFIWYFNLIMKIYYNPKAHRKHSNSNTIFLLDEPGSYLHADAQSELCKALKGFSQGAGAIIYCTHTKELLNPKHIPLQSVMIVEKKHNSENAQKRIDVRRPAVPKKRATGAERPLLEALGLPYFHTLDGQRLTILVEGIMDAYVLRMFVEPLLGSQCNIVPGTNAHTIVQLLSYFIGFDFNYVAIWDNDNMGRAKKAEAEEEFGELESKRFILLPSGESKKMKMEGMFSPHDIPAIATVACRLTNRASILFAGATINFSE